MAQHMRKVNARFIDLVTILSRQNPYLLFICFVLINIICQLCILYFLPTDTEHPAAKDPVWKQIVITVIAGPIIEMLIFQVFLIHFILKKITAMEIIAILLSAILFGLWHSTNITFMAVGFVSGLTLGILYFVFRKKKSSPFISLALIHGGFNLAALLVNKFILTSSA
jgi:LPXTG-motif cell wall-anchored protein